MGAVNQTVNSVSGNTGLSRTTVIIGLLAFMFVLFTAARGTLGQYVGLLFTSQTGGNTDPVSATQNTSIINSLQQSNTQSSTAYSNAVPAYNAAPFNF